MKKHKFIHSDRITFLLIQFITTILVGTKGVWAGF